MTVDYNFPWDAPYLVLLKFTNGYSKYFPKQENLAWMAKRRMEDKKGMIIIPEIPPGAKERNTVYQSTPIEDVVSGSYHLMSMLNRRTERAQMWIPGSGKGSYFSGLDDILPTTAVVPPVDNGKVLPAIAFVNAIAQHYGTNWYSSRDTNGSMRPTRTYTQPLTL